MPRPTSDKPSPSAEELGERLFARPWDFLLGVADLVQLPAADRPEIAFAGRSNVGKSSLINALVRFKLARTSNTPGRTQQLNFFLPTEVPLYAVDLPGYGFAKAPKAEVERWTAVLTQYLRGRVTLVRVFLLIDARHGIKPVDREIMGLLDQAAVSYQVVLTKMDKVSVAAGREVTAATAKALEKHPAAYPHVIATSAETGAGIPELRTAIAAILIGEAQEEGS